MTLSEQEKKVLFVGAYRYAFGRQTYIVSMTIDLLKNHWKDIPDGVKSIITRDLIREYEWAIEYDDWWKFGGDSDKASWLEFMDFIGAN